MEVAPNVVVRPRTRCRRSGRIEVRDLLRLHRIANVEHPDAGVEHTARQSRSATAIIDAAVVRPIGKDRQPHQVGQHLRTVRRVVDLQHQTRDDGRIGLVADVDNARHRERRETGRASRRLLRRAADTAGSAFIDEDDVGLATDLDVDGVLRGRAVLPEQLADQMCLRVRHARLNLAQVVN